MSTKFLRSSTYIFAVSLLFSSFFSRILFAGSHAEENRAGYNQSSDCFDCSNELDLHKLCAKSIKTRCLDVKKIDACSIRTEDLCVNNEFTTPAITTNNINTQSICTENLTATVGCIGQLTANSACVPGSLVSADFKQCAKYVASISFASDFLYTLGDPVNWNLLLDDPNGNVSFSPFTSYTAPETGYYMVSVQIDQRNITGANPIVGIPVTNIGLEINNIPNLQTYVPYLSFHNAQQGNSSSLVFLNAGDVVTTRYNVYVMTDAFGFSPYVGTVLIDPSSFFKIHLLSVACPTLPCAPCVVGCAPSVTGCSPIDCCNR